MPDSWAKQAYDALVALGPDPTPDAARALTDRFTDTDVLAALVKLAYEGAGGGSQSYRVARVPISSAEILTFGGANPRKVIVAAPDAGQMVLPVSYAVEYLGGTNPYVPDMGTGENFALGWGDDGSGNPVVYAHSTLQAAFDGGTRVLQQTDDKVLLGVSGLYDFDVNGSLGGSVSDMDGAALTFGFDPGGTGPGQVTGGDGTLVVIVTYAVVTL